MATPVPTPTQAPPQAAAPAAAPPEQTSASPTSKRRLLTKTNSTIVTITAVAAFLTIFCLVASKTLVSQALYQKRVASAKRDTVSVLKSDVSAANRLISSYQTFDGASTNIIGGSSTTGNGPNNGPNSQIVLDALPSAYDFPALATSLEKMITNRQLAIQGITGTDDELAQQGNTGSASPQPVAIPFSLVVSGTYANIQGLIQDLQNSIRPFQVQSLIISGSQNNMTVTIKAQTYYQPAKDLQITNKVVK